MSVEQDIYAALSADAPLQSRVHGRVHIDKRDQDEALPSVVYQRAQTEFLNSLSGVVLATTTTIGIAAVGESREQAEDVADAILTAVTGDFTPRNRISDYSPETEVYITTITFIRHTAN